MEIEVKVDIYHQIGARIRFLRNKRKLSIEELAFDCGINNNYLSDLERGSRNPTLRILMQIADGLDVSLSELCRGVSGDKANGKY